jgi:hypothetical protein
VAAVGAFFGWLAGVSQFPFPIGGEHSPPGLGSLVLPLGIRIEEIVPVKQMIRWHVARCVVLVSPLVLAVGVAQASPIVIRLEPDDYPDRTVLDHIIPQLSLDTVLSDNRPAFTVTANTDGFGYASTGVKVFGHANVPFWNNDRRMKMTFTGLTDGLSIDFIGGTFASLDTGRLEIYGSAGTLLDAYVTQPRGPGQVETMTLVRSQPDIAYAIAYCPQGQGTFGRLDNLRFDTPVPEPGSLAMLLALGGAGLVGLWRRRRLLNFET